MAQGYNARLDESLGMKHKGAHKQSLKDRRDESKGMAKKMTGHAYSGNHSMKEDKHYPKSVHSHLDRIIKK
tara:strand:+ start:300 stop:512 length:213 start_codon:yes stop_codon:yes gene_type:complete